MPRHATESGAGSGSGVAALHSQAVAGADSEAVAGSSQEAALRRLQVVDNEDEAAHILEEGTPLAERPVAGGSRVEVDRSLAEAAEAAERTRVQEAGTLQERGDLGGGCNHDLADMRWVGQGVEHSVVGHLQVEHRDLGMDPCKGLCRDRDLGEDLGMDRGRGLGRDLDMDHEGLAAQHRGLGAVRCTVVACWVVGLPEVADTQVADTHAERAGHNQVVPVAGALHLHELDSQEEQHKLEEADNHDDT